jgi:hypothetical protein
MEMGIRRFKSIGVDKFVKKHNKYIVKITSFNYDRWGEEGILIYIFMDNYRRII